MKVGIIAAGTGSRLAAGGVRTPKPLVPLCGEPMIARLIRSARRLQAEAVACIVNAVDPAVARYLRSRTWPLPVQVLVRTTPNSMESFLALAPLLAKAPFLLLTVDAVFPFRALEQLVAAGRAMAGAGGILALCTNSDDSRPLWAGIDADKKITALGEPAAGSTPYVTAGFYWFTPGVFHVGERARGRGAGALRDLLAFLPENGFPLYGLPVSSGIDVDYPEDIEKAERLLMETGERP